MALQLEVKKDDPKSILVFWEGKLWKVISKSLFFNELRKFPGNLSEEEFLERFALLEKKVGKKYAVYLLSQRALLSSALESKLLSKGLSPNAARAAVDFCLQKKYLDDDREIARLVSRELEKAKSAKAIFFKLKAKKKVDEEMLRNQIQQIAPSDGDTLKKWLLKNQRRLAFDDPQKMRKLMAKLCRRGFSPDEVFKAFEIYNSHCI
jgi:SOS response regulatory protein OraA/RecX